MSPLELIIEVLLVILLPLSALIGIIAVIACFYEPLWQYFSKLQRGQGLLLVTFLGLYSFCLFFIGLMLLGDIWRGDVSPWMITQATKSYIRYGSIEAMLTASEYLIFYSGIIFLLYSIIRAYKTTNNPSKIKIKPRDFVKAELDEIFSSNFIKMGAMDFDVLSSEYPLIAKQIKYDKYIKEWQSVICNLFRIAWDRNAPFNYENMSLIPEDPRVKLIDSDAYHRFLSRAQEAGMDTFGFISLTFLGQIIPQNSNINKTEFDALHSEYRNDLTGRYVNFENIIKKHQFI